ncbi:hypothetical protein GCM10009811_06230 [Nostocoides veronense]|uniref:Transposase n=2 Tax=Nostocoides veronense TaxID=330836 RepID=A0ABP4XLH6_9MICO
MNLDERREWESRQGQERRRIWKVMGASPAVQRAVVARATFDLACPYGHRLFTAVLDDGMEGDEFWVLPFDDGGRKSRVTEDGTFFNLGGVCGQDGCPRRTARGVAYCDEHSHGRESIVVDHLKTRFICPLASCGWSDSVLTTHLLQVVTAALTAGVADGISVTGRRADGKHKSRKR